MAKQLQGFRVAALVDDRFEQVELTKPRAALEKEGAQVDLISSHGRLTGMKHDDPGDSFQRDVALNRARVDSYDAVLIPGGVINADRLRVQPEAQQFARGMVEQEKPVAVICHGGWLLISAGLVRGRTMTSWPSLQDDYRNAGANWVDQEVVVEGNWVSSRKPDDIPAFNREMVRIFAESRARLQERRAA